jgi:dipeptidyl-peptidase-4
MSKRTATVLLICLVAVYTTSVNAAENTSLLTIDRIFHDKEFELSTRVPSKWLRGGESYTTVESSESVADGFDIVRHDSATGVESILVGAKQLIPEGAEKPLEIKKYSWAEDGRFVLISTNTVKFRRLESFGDYWLLNLADSTLRQIGTDAPVSSLMYAKFSPNSEFIAYMYLNNIYVESIDGRLGNNLQAMVLISSSMAPAIG